MPNVLVVDDEALVCEVISEGLRECAGISVTVAHDGEQAAAAFQTTSFDLALIDVLLPRMSGFHVAMLAAARDIPVLLVSGHPVAARQMEDFGWPCLKKPFSLATLQAEARRVIAEARENVVRVRESAARMRQPGERDLLS